MSEYLFIVGSPRSGTTITGKILDSHPGISTWFVPYFMWERYFRDRQDDILTESDAQPEIIKYIRRSFLFFKQRTGAKYVVDQSPRNSLRIPFIRAVFPEAKFIHVIRDPGDAVLSIRKEWQKRIEVYRSGKSPGRGMNFTRVWDPVRELVGMQPIFKHRLQALLFELRGFSVRPENHYNRRRWNGFVGWGPRFAGWRNKLESSSLLEFNAYQWRECVSAVRASLPSRGGSVFGLKYEDLLDYPRKTITSLLKFIDKEFDYGDLRKPPHLMKGNYSKWKKELSPREIESIKKIIDL